ncbi:MAG: PAS domain S-box protein [Proteobacteria bacterium]|jgi:PAS domain S-box-containing protein|nr:PAS domain S-box protein [Pseudomonadota bacterium]
MPTPLREAPAGTAARTPRRPFDRWWRRQSPARQDRLATLAPLLSVLLFLAAIISSFWYLRNEEIERESASLKRDVEITQQQIGLRLIQSQEALIRMAREFSAHRVDAGQFLEYANTFMRERPEVTQLSWIDAQRRLRYTQWAMPYRLGDDGMPIRAVLPLESRKNEVEAAFVGARATRSPVYSRPFIDPVGTPVFQLYVPLAERSAFAGALVVEYSVETLLRRFVPAEAAQRHTIAVVDATDRRLASTVTSLPGRPPSYTPIVADAPLTPALNGLMLRGQGYRTSIGLIGNTLFWMVVALSGLTVWMLLGSMRHVRRRAQIQNALVQETSFRRAMENSMPTGMRAVDPDGRITYVNAAFCQMIGFTTSELVGQLPPYPYWAPERIDENGRLLQQELQGRSPAGGIEVKMMRKDGSQFDARLYVSPLIDPRGQQTGWMSSITNITEAKRIRDLLSASHERFTTVLEGLDAAVSVLSVEQAELLFANRSYRLWFGGDAAGHLELAGGLSPSDFAPLDADGVDPLSGLPAAELTDTGAHPCEVHVEKLDKWFDVRARYLQWTDGRLAQMLIATDITARVRAEEQAAAQADKAQMTSRLVTMGEMASSLAHELNQPLTAITNYCSGMIGRVRADTIGQADLIAALQKTAHQAARAGQVIRRIRAFVKRSEPQRQKVDARAIVDDALELAGIELRRRNVAIHSDIAQRLPPLYVDPILIEQVLLNLLKNAAEAIDGAALPPARRHIELRVMPRHTLEEGAVIEFSVADRGPGLTVDVIDRLYEAFFSTKAEGLGIGLSLCRSIVESHRGRLRAENSYNGRQIVGCCFSFTLPIEARERDAGDEHVPASAGAATPAGAGTERAARAATAATSLFSTTPINE